MKKQFHGVLYFCGKEEVTNQGNFKMHQWTLQGWLQQDGGSFPIGLSDYLMTLIALLLVEASGLLS